MKYPDVIIQAVLKRYGLGMHPTVQAHLSKAIIQALRGEGWHFLSGVSRFIEDDLHGWGTKFVNSLLFDREILESQLRMTPQAKAESGPSILKQIHDQAVHDLTRVLAKRLLADFEERFGKHLTAFTEHLAVTKAEDE